MSEIISSVKQVDDKYFLILHISISSRQYDSCVLSFCPSQTVISSNSGRIYQNEVILTYGDKTANVYLNYPYGRTELDCIISFVENNRIKDHETIVVTIPFKEQVKKDVFEIPVLNTKSASFDEKMTEISINKGISEWKAELSIREDILVSFTKCMDRTGVFAFGEPSQTLLSSDYLFQANKELKQFIIPIEIFCSKKQLYTKENLGIYEVIKVDFVSSDNYYHKRLVSNLISIDKLGKIVPGKFEFKSPTGEIFVP